MRPVFNHYLPNRILESFFPPNTLWKFSNRKKVMKGQYFYHLGSQIVDTCVFVL